MKKKYLILLIIIITIGLATFFTLHIPTLKAVPELETGTVRIVSYNLKYGYSDLENFESRRDLIVEQIENYLPDSIGIQEGDYPWMSSYDGLPALLEDYDYVGVGRNDGETDGEYAAIFYLKDKYNVLDSGNFWLSETPDTPSIGWDAVDYRICTWVTLENKETGEVYTHYNTHFDHKGKTARENSAELILEKIALNEGKYFLTGDFNVLQDTKVYNILKKSDYLSDAKDLAVDSMWYGTMNWFLLINTRLLKPIDFIFVSSGIDVLSYRVDNSYWINNTPVSDHYPVIVDIEFS